MTRPKKNGPGAEITYSSADFACMDMNGVSIASAVDSFKSSMLQGSIEDHSVMQSTLSTKFSENILTVGTFAQEDTTTGPTQQQHPQLSQVEDTQKQQFPLVHVTVTILGLTGVAVQRVPLRRSLFGSKHVTKEARKGDQKLVKAVVSFSRNTTASNIFVHTHVPSLPMLEVPSDQGIAADTDGFTPRGKRRSSQTGFPTTRLLAAWPAAVHAEANNGNSGEGEGSGVHSSDNNCSHSSFSFSRVIQCEQYVNPAGQSSQPAQMEKESIKLDGKALEGAQVDANLKSHETSSNSSPTSVYIPEPVDMRIGLFRAGSNEILPLGVATVVISGEDRSVQLDLPVHRDYTGGEHVPTFSAGVDGVKMKKKSTSTKRKAKKNATCVSFASDKAQKYRIRDHAFLRIHLSVQKGRSAYTYPAVNTRTISLPVTTPKSPIRSTVVVKKKKILAPAAQDTALSSPPSPGKSANSLPEDLPQTTNSGTGVSFAVSKIQSSAKGGKQFHRTYSVGSTPSNASSPSAKSPKSNTSKKSAKSAVSTKSNKSSIATKSVLSIASSLKATARRPARGSFDDKTVGSRDHHDDIPSYLIEITTDQIGHPLGICPRLCNKGEHHKDYHAEFKFVQHNGTAGENAVGVNTSDTTSLTQAEPMSDTNPNDKKRNKADTELDDKASAMPDSAQDANLQDVPSDTKHAQPEGTRDATIEAASTKIPEAPDSKLDSNVHDILDAAKSAIRRTPSCQSEDNSIVKQAVSPSLRQTAKTGKHPQPSFVRDIMISFGVCGGISFPACSRDTTGRTKPEAAIPQEILLSAMDKDRQLRSENLTFDEALKTLSSPRKEERERALKEVQRPKRQMHWNKYTLEEETKNMQSKTEAKNCDNGTEGEANHGEESETANADRETDDEKFQQTGKRNKSADSNTDVSGSTTSQKPHIESTRSFAKAVEAMGFSVNDLEAAENITRTSNSTGTTTTESSSVSSAQNFWFRKKRTDTMTTDRASVQRSAGELTSHGEDVTYASTCSRSWTTCGDHNSKSQTSFDEETLDYTYDRDGTISTSCTGYDDYDCSTLSRTYTHEEDDDETFGTESQISSHTQGKTGSYHENSIEEAKQVLKKYANIQGVSATELVRQYDEGKQIPSSM